MDKILLGQSLSISKGLEVLEIKLKPGRLLFQCILLDYYEPLSWFMMIPIHCIITNFSLQLFNTLMMVVHSIL